MTTPDKTLLSARIKQECEDFIVSEIPSYEPSGQGDHLFLWVEKTDAAAKFTLRQLARRLNVSERDIGSAGNKDRRAVTRQYFSVLARDVDREALGDLPWEINAQIKVLKAELHGNKLRRGHLRGNRFEIIARIEPGEHTRSHLTEEMNRRVEMIRTQGLKNFYGDQRFGHDNETVELGMKLLAQDEDAIRSVRRDRFLKRLSLNAVQSAVFNDTLTARLALGEGEWKVLRGDVLELVESGGRFVCEDAVVDQARLDEGELVLTGPMHGPKMRQPEHEAGDFEREVLERRGIDPKAFASFSKLCAGARRAFKVPVADLEADVYAESEVRLSFSLPSGSYATVLLEQIFDELHS